MQYDASFLVYQLRYSADYEERTTVENATFWATKPTTPNFQLQCNSMSNPKLPQNSERVLIREKNRGLSLGETLNTLPSYLLQISNSYLSHSTFGIGLLVMNVVDIQL